MPHAPLFVHPDTPAAEPRRAYAQVLAEIDASTGRIVDVLRELELAEDTVLIFTSENGPWIEGRHHGGSAAPYSGGKGSSAEGGLRVPCLLWAPGRLPAGRVEPAMLTAFDLLPTLASWAGTQPPPGPLDGQDLNPFFNGETNALAANRAYFFFDQNGAPEGIRVGPWKLIGKGTNARLHNVVEDPAEVRDFLAQRPLDVMRLQRRLDAFRESLKAE